ncbi:MAG TPA: oligopeptide/dipeptide ABC transporter ATP-binding protein [Thermoplasmata archaeon]
MDERNVVVKVTSLSKYFDLKQGFFQIGAEPIQVKAVDDVNFEIHEGEVLGLVGESGCGKTTTGRLLTRLENPTSGSVFFLGRDIALLEGQDLKVFRRNIQMVFQDPYESLNPRTTVLSTIMEPLINHNIGRSLEERVPMVVRALEDAGLAPAKEYLERFPHELSGGQRQRVAIARALVINPKVIVADEPVSMLDVSIRAGVLNLMLDLRDKYHIPYLFITHDIAVARYVSDRLAVMYLGRVVELGDTDDIIFNPKHPYTKALLSAVPVPDPEHKHKRIAIKGEIPSATSIPLGCRFRTRCPFSFKDCGWEGKDLIEYLLDEEKMMAPDHPMSGEIEGIEPMEFSCVIRVREGGSPTKVKGFIESKITALKDKVPMFQAIATVDEADGNRELVVPTKSVSVPREYVAETLLSSLNDAVDYRSRGHPMYGTIMDARQEDARIILTIGAEAEKAAGGRSKVENTIAFMRDFVKHLKNVGYSEFKGISRFDGSKNNVVIRCSPGRLSSKRVAKQIAEMVYADMLDNPNSHFHNAMLPPRAKGAKVVLVAHGPEMRWKELESSLKTYLDKKAQAGVWAAKGTKAPRTRVSKKPARMVIVRFIKVVEPPLVDTGKGHQVACYLFKETAS